MNRKQYAIALVFSISLLIVALVPLSGQQGSSYNPWLDYNGDGLINVEDLHALGQVYGTSGTPLNMPMTLQYDSGWIDIHDKHGQYFSVTPGFDLSASMWTPSISGKVVGDPSVHQKYWYGYGMPGWNKTYGGASDDYGLSVVETSDGGYAIAGYTNSFGLSNQMYLVKTDSGGTMAWSKTYGGANWDEAHSVVETSDGGYAIAGYTNSYGSGYQVYLVKTFADGTMAWNETYGRPNNDYGFSGVQTSDGGYAIAGYTNSYGSGYQVYLVKTFAGGTMAWNETYGGAGSDYGYSVVQTSDGGYAIVGYTDSYGSGYQVYLVKTKSGGTMDWSKTYGGSGNDYGRSVVQTSDGGYAIVGYTDSYGSLFQVYLVKTFANGTMAWSKTYGGSGWDYGTSVVQTSDGGYAIAGNTDLAGSLGQVYLVKTFVDGTMAWSKTLGGSGSNYGQSVVQTSDGGYAIAGNTDSFGSLNQVYLVKTDAFGLTDLEWGVTITNFTADAVTFYKGKIDPYYNYIRVQIWVVKETP